MARAISMNTPNEILAIDLSRALSRLEQKILASPPNSRLHHSSFERTKTAANLEYARSLLLRLEHESASIKIQSRKQAAQTKLISQRALLKTLTDRLHELDQRDDSNAFSSSSSEDLVGDNASKIVRAPPSCPPQSPSLSRRKKSPESTLRNRLHPSSATTQEPSSTSSAASSTAPLLDSDSQTQAALTTSLLSLATSLKQSSLAFSSSLALDAEALSRAAEGLDRNATGMEAAGKRMGTLRRMTEGRGWWGRMMFYTWIAGLWVVALLLVFVMPKLRF